MNNKVFLKKFVVGDIHNVWMGTIGTHVKQFSDDVERAERIGVGNIAYLQVGDFGIGHTNDIREDISRLVQLNKVLVDHLSYLYIIRGNHDDPSWFKNENYKDIKSMLSNIMFIPDYTILTLDNEDFLFVGGAISIDRIPNRLKSHPAYWSDEGFVLDEDKIKKLGNVDRIVTHTSPDFCPPQQMGGIVYDFATSFKDRTLIDELKNERKDLTIFFTSISSKNRIKSHFYGHFHRSATFYHNGCEFKCLNINEFYRV